MVLSRLDPYRCQSVQHTDPSAGPALLSHFNTCRLESRYTDVEVVVGEEVFPCHRIILDFVCPFFQSLCSFYEHRAGGTGGEQQEERVGEGEKRAQRVKLKSDHVTSQAFKTLLGFMYTAELQVTLENVVDVMMCADFLQILQAKRLCADLLLQNITVETCLSALVVGQALNLHDLEEAAFEFIQSNLADVMKEEGFRQLSPEVLASIVKNPCLEVEREVTVVEAVLLWVQGCPEQRRPLMHELLQHARLCPEDLLELREQRVALTDTDLTQKAGAKRDLMDDSLLDGLTVSSLPYRLTEVLVTVSRKVIQVDIVTLTVYFYCPLAKKWYEMTSLPNVNWDKFSMAVVNNRLYLTGGYSNEARGSALSRGLQVSYSKETSKVHREYDPLKNTWTTQQPMRVARFDHGVACMGKKLYVLGGNMAVNSTNLVADGEVYDPATNQWTTIPPVCDVRGISGPGLAALSGKLYLVGGASHTLPDPTKGPTVYCGAQVYDPERQVWKRLPALEEEVKKRQLHLVSTGVLAADGMLLLVNSSQEQNFFVYNPLSHTLDLLGQMLLHHKLWPPSIRLFQGQLLFADWEQRVFHDLTVDQKDYEWCIRLEESDLQLSQDTTLQAYVNMHVELSCPSSPQRSDSDQ